jgi:hypothetical protein
MDVQRRAHLPLLLLGLALGCGESTHTAPDGGDEASSPRCVPFARLLLPDAEPNTCAFSPADIACTTDDDCKPYYVRGCSSCGVFAVVGQSQMNTVNCPVPPCVPPSQPVPPCVDAGYTTQSCQFVSHYSDVAAACVNGQCMTYAVDGGSE